MNWLLDGNVLLALILPNNVHPERVHRLAGRYASGPLCGSPCARASAEGIGGLWFRSSESVCIL